MSESPTGLRAYAALLRGNFDARMLWFAQVVSQLGNWFSSVALLGLLAEIGDNPAAGNLVSVAQIVPMALAGLFVSGAVADRFDRKTIMISMDLLRTALALSFLWIRTPETTWIAYAGTIGLSIGTAFYQPASSAAMPNVVAPHELPIVSMLGQTTFATMLFVGAFLGGAVTTLFGRDAAFVLNAASFAASAFFISRTRASFSDGRRRESLGGAGVVRVLTEGLRYLRRDAFVRAYMLAKPAAAWALGAFGLFGAYSVTIYDAGDWGTSLLYAGRGIGAFVSPLLVAGLIARQDLPRMHRVISIGMLLVAAGYGCFAFTTSPYVGMLCALVAHWGNAWAMSVSGLIVQANTPDYVRGRVMALDNVGWSVVSSISNLIVAAVALRTSLQWGAFAAASLTAVGGLWWIVAYRKLPHQAGPGAAATATPRAS